MLAAFAAVPLPDERLMEIRHSPKALGPASGLSAVLGRNAFERPGDCDQARPRLCGGNWNKSQGVPGAMCLYLNPTSIPDVHQQANGGVYQFGVPRRDPGLSNARYRAARRPAAS